MPEHRQAKQGTRTLRRLARRERSRTRRFQNRLRTGQTLIIFALSFTVLLSLAGLAIDVARAYDLYAKMQRAAEAGAIAGVLYMPSYYNTARTPGDGLSAVERASAEVAKDGIGAALPVNDPQASACPTSPATIEVAVCPVASKPGDLRVTITEQMSVVLLGGLGIQPITLQTSAQSEYLPPVQIGSRENYFGDQMECTIDNIVFTACNPKDTTQTHVQSFVASVNGPADIKESGDPMVYCEEGPANLTPPGADTQTTTTTYNGYTTNHPQQPGTSNGLTGISQYCGQPVPGTRPGNPDYQPDGYDGPKTTGTAHDGGYNYAINVSSAISSATLWIFNPYYIPQNSSLAMDQFIDNGANNFYQGPKEEGIGNRFDGSHYDAPLFYYNTTFTLYKVTNLYDRTTDRQVWSQTYQPYDDIGTDLNQHGCGSGKVYDPQYAGASTTANTYHNATQIQWNAPGECVSPPTCEPVTSATPWTTWCEALQPGTSTPVTLTTGAYRLVVEVTGIPAAASNGAGGYDYNSGLQDGWGSHSYALKLCNGAPLSAVNCASGAAPGQYVNNNLTIFGWNNVDLIFEQQLANTTPNANVPSTSCVTGTTLKYACVDLGCIPSVYAGRTVTAGLFDPGDGTGDLYVGVVPPAGSGTTVTVSPPSYATALSGPNYDNDSVVQARSASASYTSFNGLWLNFTIQLNSTYQGDCAATTGGTSGKSGWFQMVYMSSNGNPHDKLAVNFTLVGSPVHLVPSLG